MLNYRLRYQREEISIQQFSFGHLPDSVDKNITFYYQYYCFSPVFFEITVKSHKKPLFHHDVNDALQLVTLQVAAGW